MAPSSIAAALPVQMIRCFAESAAMIKFNALETKSAMEVIKKDVLLGPRLNMTAEEAAESQSAAWENAVSGVMVNAQNRRLSPEECNNRLEQLLQPALEDIPIDWFVDANLKDSIVHAFSF